MLCGACSAIAVPVEIVYLKQGDALHRSEHCRGLCRKADSLSGGLWAECYGQWQKMAKFTQWSSAAPALRGLSPGLESSRAHDFRELNAA
jgi:hypothetical protein